MSKVWLISRHELMVTVRRLSYILLTVGLPLLGLLFVVFFQFVAEQTRAAFTADERLLLGYVDRAGLVSGSDSEAFVAFPDEQVAKRALLDGQISEYFIIEADYLETGRVTRYSIKRDVSLSAGAKRMLEDFLLTHLLAGEVTPAVVERAKTPLAAVSFRLDESGKIDTTPEGVAEILVPMLFGILLAVSIFTSSGFLLQGVATEKENRVVEILLSSVSSRQLLAGKVLGLGAAGLLQMLIWVASIRLMIPLASIQFGFLGTISVPPSLIALGLAYFLLGYLLFSVIMAGVGSLGTTMREGQQLAGAFTMTAVIPLMVSSLIVTSPDHIISRVLSLFPTSAPIAMMMRLAVQDVPIWEVGVSLVLLTTTVAGAMVVAAKVFRMGLLVYGRRPGLREVVRYLREA